jgi:HAD superfamily hydrolase (TIGR01549 family)
MRNQDIVVLDFDGVIVDLNLPTELIRQDIAKPFAALNIVLPFRPLLKELKKALDILSTRSATQAADMQKEIWQFIDEKEIEAAQNCSIRPGVIEFLDSIKHLPIVIYSNNCPQAINQALHSNGVPKDYFRRILGRDVPSSIKPSAEPLIEIANDFGLDQIRRIFFIGDQPADMQSAKMSRAVLQENHSPIDLVAIGIRNKRRWLDELDQAGAWFTVSDLREAAKFIMAQQQDIAISVVVSAHNDEKTLLHAVEDIRRFCKLYVTNYEIVISNDGSTDGTARIARSLSQADDIRSVHHPVQLGIGAAMRDGYIAAKKDFITHLTADRSVRAQSLIHFIEQLSPDDQNRVVAGKYISALSSSHRGWSGQAFHFLLRWLAGLKVYFTGTYIFKRNQLESIPARTIGSNTLLFGFEILHQLRGKGVEIQSVRIHSFEKIGKTNNHLWQAGTMRTISEMLNIRMRN